MRYSLIIAGGSGTRLWPMSRSHLPKQLIPFMDGKSLLQLAADRLEGMIPPQRRLICAGSSHRDLILHAIAGTPVDCYYGEPLGRDTLNAIGLVCAHLARRDPEAVVAVFSADHVIQPIAEFQRLVAVGYEMAENHPNALVTFGITPTHPATGYGYLELGQPLTDGQGGSTPVRRLSQFREKPDLVTASRYITAGPEKYLWNSGMFVWRAATLMECVKKYHPLNHAGLMKLAAAWDTPQRETELAAIYPTLPKISIDYAVMEPASKDPSMIVAAVPMPLQWLDVGSWPSFAAICPKDDQGNATSPADAPRVILDSHNNLIATSDSKHLIAAVGVEGLIIVHTPEATLVCKADRAEEIKNVHKTIAETHGKNYV